MLLFCDLETFSATPIRAGSFRYAEDPEARILLWGYAIDDAPAKVWDAANEPIPEDLLRAIRIVQSDSASKHVWHNGINFDTVFIERVRPDLAMPLNRVIDTMVLAYEHGLPGALGDLCTVFGLPTDKAKDRDGARLIRLFCAPRPEGGVFSKADHPEDWARFVNYCRLDVEAERAVYEKLPKFNRTMNEHCLMMLDAEINRRGMLMDVDLAKGAVEALEASAERLRERTRELTDGAVDSATQSKALIDFILGKWGIELKNLQKSEVARLLEQPEIPEPMKELLRTRLNSAKASVKKYQALLDSVCKDGRLRGCLQFRGASRTGRWSGRLFQPQNMSRPTMSQDEIEEAIQATKDGALGMLYENVEEPLTNCLRGAITVPRGKRMVVADYSNIEGRVLAWMAGESWKLKAFEAYDAGTGPDLYKLTYSKAFNVPVESVTKAQRQVGKVLELAMGYGGGVGAFTTFATAYGIELASMAEAVLPVIPSRVRNEAEMAFEWAERNDRTLGLTRAVWVACDAVKRLWRESNPHIVNYWARIGEACKLAIERGQRIQVGQVTAGRWKNWLLLQLPSKRCLCYPAARIEEDSDAFTFMGVDQVSRRWSRISTYGPKCVENIIQATACDVLSVALFNIASSQDFKAILTVHDEVLCEAPDDDAHDHTVLEKLMEKKPAWAQDLPLKAAGFEAYRYRK